MSAEDKSIDVGQYNLDSERFEQIVRQMQEENPPITLTSEYAHWCKDNLLRFLIRLARYKFVAKMLKETDRVLEVGSGSGLGAVFLAQHCQHVHGLELKDYEIEEAHSMNRRENVTFDRTDFFEYNPDEKPDVIVGLDLIEHMDVPTGRKLVAQAARLLKPTGMLIFGTPSIYSYPHQSEISQASHIHCYDQDELVELIDEYFGRTLPFSMNDEIVHTGHKKMAWYYYVIATVPQPGND